MKQTPFWKYCIQLFLSSVLGVFLCYCINLLLNITDPNFWQRLFMAVVYLFMYSLFPYYVSLQQADRDRKILRYKEKYPEEVPYTLESLKQPYKGLKAGFIAVIPHALTILLPLLFFFGITQNNNGLYLTLNMHLREFINLALPLEGKGTLFGMVLLVLYQLFLPAVSHFGYNVAYKEIPVLKNILYKKKKDK